MVRVFLDANVYFARCFSSTGASALILQLAKGRHFQLIASRLVLREAERNLRAKSNRQSLQTFHRLLHDIKLRVVRAPADAVLARYEEAIHPKDVPVLAAAIESRADYLVTLDRRHFLTPMVAARAGSTRVLMPGDFLKELVRRPHPES